MVIARSSLFETMILLELLRDVKLFNPTKYDDLYKEGEEIFQNTLYDDFKLWKEYFK